MSERPESGWRGRLVDELKLRTKRDARDKADTRPSMSAASLEAGLGRNFVQQVINGQQSVGLDNLIALCEVLEISVSHILTGVRWDQDIQEALAAFTALKQHDPVAFESFRGVLRGLQARVLDEVDSNMEAASQRVRKPGAARQ